MIHIDKKNRAKKLQARWRAKMLGPFFVKKSTFEPIRFTPTEQRCWERERGVLIKTIVAERL